MNKFYTNSGKENEENTIDKGHSSLKQRVTTVFIIILAILLIGVFYNGQSRYNYIKTEFDYLGDEYDILERQHNSLSNDYGNLETRYNNKVNDYNSLQTRYENKVSDYNYLQSNYNSLQDNYESLGGSFDEYRQEIEFRYGDGDDCKLFITPDDYSVKSKTRNALGHYSDNDLSWDDKMDIFDWVVDNIDYNHDTFIGDRRNCFFYPSETIDLGYGDCEDQSVLYVSMCKSEEDVGWIYCTSVTYIKNGERVGHVFVINNIVDDQMYIFDPTHSWKSSSSMSEYNIISEYENHFGYYDLRILKIFNDDMYKTFSSNQEFFDYF